MIFRRREENYPSYLSLLSGFSFQWVFNVRTSNCSGTHSELVEAGGIYAQLVKAQQFQPETGDAEEGQEKEEVDEMIAG